MTSWSWILWELSLIHIYVKGLTNLEDVKEIIEHDFAEAGNGGYIVVPAKVLYAPDYGCLLYTSFSISRMCSHSTL